MWRFYEVLDYRAALMYYYFCQMTPRERLTVNKKYYMVLDTETVADARVPYDVAWILVDRAGNVIERFNGLTAEVLTNPTLRYLVKRDSFSKRKAAFYLDDASAQVIPFKDIMDYTRGIIADYDATVVAYNAGFDVKVLNDYAVILCGEQFFAENTPVWDLWNMALNTICNSSNYVRWCIESGFITEKGNISCSAEAVYSYLSQESDFEEDHTALSDCEIEAQILQAVFDRKQKLETGMCSPVFRQKVWKNRLQCKN